MADDPFTQALNSIWELLESHAGFTGLVRLKNRIKMSGKSAGNSEAQILSADLPEVSIEPAGGSVQLFATSTSCRAVQDYSVAMSTGDSRADQLLFPLKWEFMKALSKSGDHLSLSFVKKVRIGQIVETADRRAEPRTDGWSARLVITVEMWFDIASLQS